MIRMILFSGLLLTSCDHMFIDSTLNKMVRLGKEKYGLDCFGRGVYAPFKINKFDIVFRTNKSYDLMEAQKLMIDYTEDYITLINETPRVTDNINNPPVSEYKLSLFVAFKDDKDEYQKELPAIQLSNGILTFYKLDPLGELIPNYEESYTNIFFAVYGIKPPIREHPTWLRNFDL